MKLLNKYDFVMLFDVENGNPNGDPDLGNMPRIDSETNIGLVTDVCLKRKIRNYVELVKNSEESFNILIKADESLNSKFTRLYKENGLPTSKGKEEESDSDTEENDGDKKRKKKPKDREKVEKARDFACQNFFDVRTFGAVMSTGVDPCGIVRGPVQINFARSVEPICPQEITVTRQAVTTNKDFKTDDNTMGTKYVVPYALYRAEGYVSAPLANKTGFDTDDLELLFEAIENMFENDHSSLRGKMCMRKIIIFKHGNLLGCTPSHKLFELVEIKKVDENKVSRNYTDYIVNVASEMPTGVEVEIR